MHTTISATLDIAPPFNDAFLASCQGGLGLKLTCLLLGLLCVIGIVSGRRDARILDHVTSGCPVNSQSNHADR